MHYKGAQLLGQGDPRPVINATACREKWCGSNGHNFHSSFGQIIEYPNFEASHPRCVDLII
jgi:hypothetical protein